MPFGVKKPWAKAMSRGQCGRRSRPQPSQQMESIYFPQGTSDLRTFCLLAASKHISQAGFCWPRPPSPGALTQPAHGSSGSRGARSARLTAAPAVVLCGREQLGSERRDCGIEHQQAYPALATGRRFRTLPACLGKGMERLTVPGVGSCQTQ